MKKIIVLSIMLAAIGIAMPAMAQLRKVPAEVTEAFREKYPDSKNVEWKDRLSAFQVDYELGDTHFTSKFSSKGEWLQTETAIGEAALPGEVKEGFGKSKFTAWELKSVARIENKDSDIQYRLMVRKSGVEKKYLYFDETGKLLKDSFTL